MWTWAVQPVIGLYRVYKADFQLLFSGHGDTESNYYSTRMVAISHIKLILYNGNLKQIFYTYFPAAQWTNDKSEVLLRNTRFDFEAFPNVRLLKNSKRKTLKQNPEVVIKLLYILYLSKYLR